MLWSCEYVPSIPVFLKFILLTLFSEAYPTYSMQQRSRKVPDKHFADMTKGSWSTIKSHGSPHSESPSPQQANNLNTQEHPATIVAYRVLGCYILSYPKEKLTPSWFRVSWKTAPFFCTFFSKGCYSGVTAGINLLLRQVLGHRSIPLTSQERLGAHSKKDWWNVHFFNWWRILRVVGQSFELFIFLTLMWHLMVTPRAW